MHRREHFPFSSAPLWLCRFEAKREEEGVRLTSVEEQSANYASAKLRLLDNDPLPFVYFRWKGIQ